MIDSNPLELKFHEYNVGMHVAQIREQMSDPDLHVLTLKFLALKNWFFPIKYIFQKIF